MNPNDDGPALIHRCGGRPDVQIQAVLAGLWLLRGAPGLNARRRKCVRAAYALPCNDRLWNLPAQITDRRRRERNAFEYAYPINHSSFDGPTRHAGGFYRCQGHVPDTCQQQSEQSRVQRHNLFLTINRPDIATIVAYAMFQPYAETSERSGRS